MFFDNAVIGVFANHFGGWQAWKITLASGLMESLVVSGCLLAGMKDDWLGMFDFATIVPAFMQGMQISTMTIGVILLGAVVYMIFAGRTLRAEAAEKEAVLSQV